MSYVEWGEKLSLYGPANFYFGKYLWEYSAPNYMPLSMFIFAGIYRLYEHRYLLAELHNIIKIPPAFFIVYFYEHGQILLLKLLSILSDLGLGVLIYYLVDLLTKNKKKAFLGLTFFVLNPVTIFISGGWGQTDSLVALLGFLSFVLLVRGRLAFSILLLFVSLYIKPSWGLFLPLYLFLAIKHRPKLADIVMGLSVSFVVFWIVTVPFADGRVVEFVYRLWTEKFSYAQTEGVRASISAFNFYTIFLRIDKAYANSRILGISAKLIGNSVFTLSYLASLVYIAKTKDKLLATISSIFMIGFASFLFLPSMLERYFFPALAPLVVLMFVNPRILFYGVIINITAFANVIWSFFRRSSDEIDHPFTNYNFLLLRALSGLNVYYWFKIIGELGFVKNIKARLLPR